MAHVTRSLDNDFAVARIGMSDRYQDKLVEIWRKRDGRLEISWWSGRCKPAKIGMVQETWKLTQEVIDILSQPVHKVKMTGKRPDGDEHKIFLYLTSPEIYEFHRYIKVEAGKEGCALAAVWVKEFFDSYQADAPPGYSLRFGDRLIFQKEEEE